MTYEVFLKGECSLVVKGVGYINFNETEIVLRDNDSNILCVVNKSEYEGILKVG